MRTPNADLHEAWANEIDMLYLGHLAEAKGAVGLMGSEIGSGASRRSIFSRHSEQSFRINR